MSFPENLRARGLLLPAWRSSSTEHRQNRRFDVSIDQILLTLSLIYCCLPYLSPGPFGAPSQVQPWPALIAWAYVAYRVLFGGIRIPVLAGLLLLISVWFVVYVYHAEVFDYWYYLRKSSAFLLSAGIMLAMQYISPRQLWRALKITLPLWFLFAILGYISPAIYFAVVKPFIPTVIGVAGGRGATSLAPEATDFGFTMAYMVLIVIIARARLKSEGHKPSRWPLYLAIVNLALSKSGSGYSAGLVIALLYVLTIKRVSPGMRLLQGVGIAGVLLGGYIFAQISATTNVRGLDLIALAIRSPASLLNTTLSYRIVHNVVGVLGAVDSNLLGYGSGAFLNKAPLLYEKYGLGSVFGLTGWYATNVPATLSVSPVAFFPVILMEYGVIGLLYIVLVFRIVLTSRVPYKLICAAMVFLTWVQSFPAAYPFLWLILGLSLNWAFQEASGAPTPRPLGRRLPLGLKRSGKAFR